MPTVQAKITIKRSLEDVFAYHIDLGSLVAMAPFFARISLERVPSRFEVGARFALRGSLFGLVTILDWQGEIVEYAQNQYFIDTERGGIFKLFKHRHGFSATDSGDCLLHDELSFQTKLGPVVDELLAPIVGLALKQKLIMTKATMEKA